MIHEHIVDQCSPAVWWAWWAATSLFFLATSLKIGLEKIWFLWGKNRINQIFLLNQILIRLNWFIWFFPHSQQTRIRNNNMFYQFVQLSQNNSTHNLFGVALWHNQSTTRCNHNDHQNVLPTNLLSLDTRLSCIMPCCPYCLASQ